MKIADIRISDIVTLQNIREADPNSTDIQELAALMRESGQKIEVRVYPAGEKYILTVGHRRLLAATLNGWDTIRAVIEEPPTDEAELLITQYNENEQRLGLSYIDRAHVYARLKELGMTQREIARTFNRTDADISLALAALRAPEKIQQAVNDGRLAPSAIEPILSLSPEEQEELTSAVIQAKTVRNVKKVVNTYQASKSAYNVKKNSQTEVPENTDPLELMTMAEIEEAIDHLKTAVDNPITNPQLVRTARPKVEELIRMAARLKQSMDGKTWDDTKDLI